jgi:hypothetical protein
MALMLNNYNDHLLDQDQRDVGQFCDAGAAFCDAYVFRLTYAVNRKYFAFCSEVSSGGQSHGYTATYIFSIFH